MPQSTITGTILNPAGTALQYVLVKARLKPRPAFDATYFDEFSPTYEAITDASGVYSFILERTSNILPANSWYEITEYIPDRYGGPVKHVIQVGALDVTVYESLVSTPPAPTTQVFLTQAAADARYVASPGSFGAVGTISTIEPDDAAAAGVLASYARSDHQHQIVGAVAGSIVPNDTAAEGVATSFSRSDHKHGIVRTSGTAAQRTAWKAAAVPGQLYYETDTDKVYLSVESGGDSQFGLVGGSDTYTPVITQGVSVNIAHTKTTADVNRIGTFVQLALYLALTAAGTAGSDVTITLPHVSALANGSMLGSGLVLDASTGLYYVCAVIQVTTSTIKFTVPALGTWGNNPNLALASGDNLSVNLSYRAVA